MIECKNVTLGYGGEELIRDIGFTAKSGEITVILGKNGCGKTTLFRAVSGSVRYRGSIGIDGAEVHSLSAGERAKKIALMPQMLRAPDITVRELVSFGRQPYTGAAGILSRRDKQIVEGVIERTGLSSLSEKRLGCISGGERQKASIALLLAQETDNLLLDEPGAHLDAFYTRQLMDFLTEEKRGGKTVLAVLHDINRAIEIADKIIVIQDGKLFFNGTSNDFCGSNVPEAVFGLRSYRCAAEDSGAEKYCFL